MTKILGYKNNINSFLIKNEKKIDLDELNVLMCVLFLTNFYKHSKNSNLAYHGYYALVGLLTLYKEIEKNIIDELQIENHKISNIIIIQICKNIQYLNEKINYKNESKKKISKNLPEFLLFINNNLEYIVDSENIYLKATSNLKYFFIILWSLSYFMGTGEILKNHEKMCEYYACIFYAGICVKKKDTVCELLNNYLENKERLISLCISKNNYDENIQNVIEHLDKYMGFKN